jgi:DNA-binding Lrp family transcriptional regulator
MVNAIILINSERSKISEVAQALVDLKGVSEVYSVAGRYDLVAILRVKANEDVAELVTKHITAIAGIERTETLIAFQAYSKHDLEAMFSVGF